MTFAERHPPILDGACPLATLTITWAHHRALHGGFRNTSAYAVKRAWIIGGFRKVTAFLRSCVTCARLQARSAVQLMAPLPQSRVTSFHAFSRLGIDYAGLFHVLAAKGRGVRTTKGYIAIFVCLTTKALHLELVGNLSTVSFFAALTRFSADTELRDALHLAEHWWDLVASALADQGIEWHFIPLGAPHFGGLWEAAVKSVKGHLRRVMGSRHLTYEEFSTVLIGIKAVLNNRPLTPLSGDTDDLGMLTPGHFLIGSPLNLIIEAAPPDEDLHHLAYWELFRGIKAQFWAR
ncbi:uncharacterized protein LOC106640941 [Copidosoma floridanum]|uniref:uncharacterized protein LOC106640941 n=1 Tax=Copidosoma floridanum TaxID=29053 RepID=UPI0006C99B97|nr:uncharacterized protein LOC106640941 [Copidosoma floridanum]